MSSNKSYEELETEKWKLFNEVHKLESVNKSLEEKIQRYEKQLSNIQTLIHSAEFYRADSVRVEDIITAFKEMA